MSRLLVAYGTKHGSTAEIAERIGETLRSDGHEADVLVRVPPKPGNFMERSTLKNTPEEKRDARDFEAIAAWAHRVGQELGASPP
jgi:hypothetical protein